MPRVAGGRPAAEPSSRGQRARHVRILRAAAHLGARHGLEGVQMQEVARRAEVAIATLYRYFPSKTHLFVGVMADLVTRTRRTFAEAPPGGGTAAEAVFTVMRHTQRSLLHTPALATAMLTSANAANAAAVTDVGRIDGDFRAIILDAARLAEPTPADIARIRLLLQLWYGVLQSGLNGRVALTDAESDLHLACTLLLGDPVPRPDTADPGPTTP